MPLTFSDRVQADLALLGRMTTAHANEFCRVCLEAVETGMKKSMYKAAAAALGMEVDLVSACVMALTHVLLSAAKAGSSDAELHAALSDIDMPEPTRKAIVDFYSGAARRLRAHLGVEASSMHSYKALAWRLQIDVASRHAHDLMMPQYVMQMDTLTPAAASGGAGGVDRFEFSSDFASLHAASASLSAAVAELNTPHAKRTVRYIH